MPQMIRLSALGIHASWQLWQLTQQCVQFLEHRDKPWQGNVQHFFSVLCDPLFCSNGAIDPVPSHSCAQLKVSIY